MNITPTVKQLLIINVLFYIGSMIVGEPAYKLLSMYFFENPDFHFWQIVTHMFMHAPLPNIMHIAFNMFALYSFGSALEHFWGGKKFVFFYISCGVGAALLHTAVNYYYFESGINILIENGYQKAEILKLISEGRYNPSWLESLSVSDLQGLFDAYNGNVVGASGAIYGLLVAFAFMFPNAELALMFIPIPIKAKYFVPGILAIDLFLGFKGQSIFGAGSTGIAHFAHVGGALTGYLMMWYWKKNQFNNRRWN
jgi:membrane associated rhomboid family serine protease